MASKAHALAVLLTLSMALLLSEAQIAPSPSSTAQAPQDMAILVPKLEGVQQSLEKYVATMPESPSKPCLQGCMGTFKKGVDDLKAFIATNSKDDIAGGFDMFTGPEMDSCRQCLKDATATDPEIQKIMSVFDDATAQAGDQVNKEMS